MDDYDCYWHSTRAGHGTRPRDPLVREWLERIVSSVAQGRREARVTVIDPFPYDAIVVWQCDRCGCAVPTTVYGHKICGY